MRSLPQLILFVLSFQPSALDFYQTLSLIKGKPFWKKNQYWSRTRTYHFSVTFSGRYATKLYPVLQSSYTPNEYKPIFMHFKM